MRKVIVLLAAALCASCSSERDVGEVIPAPVLPCEQWRDPDGLHCTVSIYSLISFPAKYDKTIVSVKGYVSDGQYIVLFANRESAEYSILENGIRLQAGPEHMPRLLRAARSGQYIRVTGEFVPEEQDAHVLDKGSTHTTAGSLSIRTVSAEDEDAWACSIVNERPLKERFMRVDACRNLDARKELERKAASTKAAPSNK